MGIRFNISDLSAARGAQASTVKHRLGKAAGPILLDPGDVLTIKVSPTVRTSPRASMIVRKRDAQEPREPGG